MRIAINGFGRIGRLVLRAALSRTEKNQLEFVAINDLADAESLAYLFEYDSIHHRWPGRVELDGDDLVIDGQHVLLLQEPDLPRLPWEAMGIDLVIESTGCHRDRKRAHQHLEAGAGWCLLSAPASGMDATVVLGVNDRALDPHRHRLVSCASCTTNALAPVAQVLHRSFGIVSGFVNTVHGYTGDQALLDAPRGKGRRDRAAALNLIPTTTGAAKAVGEVLPELRGRLDGMATRTPNPDGSLVDLTAVLEREASVEEVNQAFRDATAFPEMAEVLGVSEKGLVSTDVLGDPRSSIVDLPSTMSLGPHVKVLAWYDNEWGYANRLIEVADRIAVACADRSPLAAARSAS